MAEMREVPICRIVSQEIASDGPMGENGQVEEQGFCAGINDQPIGIPLDRVFKEFKVDIAEVLGAPDAPNAIQIFRRFRLWLIPHFVGLIRKTGQAEPTAVGIDVEYLHQDETCSTISLIPAPQFVEHGKFEASVGISGEIENVSLKGVPQLARDFLGLKFAGQAKAGFALNVSAHVVTPYIAAIGKGASYCHWRFDKADVPLFGRDIEAWSIIALNKWQGTLQFRSRFYFDSRVFWLSRRIESDWVEIECKLCD